MLLTVLIIAALAAAGSYLLALVSDAFADGLSRVVEAGFDVVEYRTALRRERRRAGGSGAGRAACAPSFSHAG